MADLQEAPAHASPDGAPAGIATFHHVGLAVPVDDYERMIEWYTEVLDLNIHYKGTWNENLLCFTSNDAANHRVVFLSHPVLQPPPKGPYAGMDHSAFEFATLADLLAKYEALRDRGILPYMTIDHGLTISFYYEDPCGFRVELQVDAHRDWNKSSDFIRGPEFEANPVGVLVDPDDLLEESNRGLPLEQIHHNAYYDGAYPPTAEQRRRLAVLGQPLRNAWDHPSWGDDHPTFAV